MVTEMRAVLCGMQMASALVFTREVWISISAFGVQQGRGQLPRLEHHHRRCEFRDELREHRFELLKDLVRFFKEYMPHYGYKHLCTEDDDYKYY